MWSTRGASGALGPNREISGLSSLLAVTIVPYFAVYNVPFFVQIFEGNVRMLIIHG